MKKTLLLIAAGLLSSAVSQAVTEAFSPPVGGTQVTFDQGIRFTGMSFLNPSVAQGIVSGASGSIITMTGSLANIGANLVTGGAYYLELTAGSTTTYVGDRFDIDVTATQASANSTVTVSLASVNNTLPSLPLDLTGYTAVIRPHVTIGQLFGTILNPLMNGSTIASSADQVLLYNSQAQAFETYYFLSNASGTIKQWTKVGGGSTNRDGVLIPPGVGVVVIRNIATPVTLTWMGSIRFNAFAQPLVAGNNLVCQPFPIDASPSSRAMLTVNGMTGSTSTASADKIQFPVSGVFKTYYLLRNAAGTIEQWTLVGGGSTNRNNELLFPLNGAAIIYKISPDSNYLVPSTLSL